MTGPAPDVIVGWLQNDYGKLGRAGEAIAHSLVRSSAAGRVAYVEPFVPGQGEPHLGARNDRGLFVFSGTGNPPTGRHEVADGVVRLAELNDPDLPQLRRLRGQLVASLRVRARVLAHRAGGLRQARPMGCDGSPQGRCSSSVRAQLIASSDVVVGLSEGSIDDIPHATYVGHGVDHHWHEPAIDSLPEPPDLAPIDHPRAIYVGALSMRFDVQAVRELAASGVEVVLVGMAPTQELLELAASDRHVHLLGERLPEQTAAYLLHADVGIVPHTDEPFTYSMEPHKAYNYAAAGLRTVTLNTAHAPALGPFLNATRDRQAFVQGVGAAATQGRLSAEQVTQARGLSWDRVAEAIVAAAQTVGS